MPISSPFRKSSHSRENSKDGAAPAIGHPQQLQGPGYKGRTVPIQRPSTGPSYSQKPRPTQPQPQPQQLKKTNTMRSSASTSSSASTALAQQYEHDKQRLIKYCFSHKDPEGVLIDNYITHVRIIEDSAYPSSKPPPTSSKSNKKPRILALAVKKDGTVYLHKGRENANGSFQIGRTWSLNELSKIAKEPTVDTGFLCTLGKDYYWETNTPTERQVFVTTFVRIYRKFKHGLVPQLVNWDLSIFGLDENSYKMSLNKEVLDRKTSVVSQNTPKSIPIQSPKKPSSSSPKKSHTPSTSPEKSMVNVPQKMPDSYARRPSTATSSSKKSIPPPIDVPPASSTPPKRVMVPVPAPVLTPPLANTKPPTKAPSVSTASSGLLGSTEESPIDLDLDIDEQMRQLGLDEPATLPPSKSRDAQRALDIPDRGAVSTMESLAPSSTISSSARGVEIKAHRRSLIHPEDVSSDDEDDDDDDITDLYRDDSEPPLESSVLNDTVDQVVTPEDSQDFSFENSYDEDEPSHDKINATPKAMPFPSEPHETPKAIPFPTDNTPATIKADVLSDNEEDGYDDLNDAPVASLDVPRAQTRRRRANTMESVMENQDTDRSSFDDIFDEINWDSSDDADTLVLKLMKELAETEYETTKQLVDVRAMSSQLETHGGQITQECEKITPMLNLFAVELTGFAHDIQQVENQGRGLQVETINKKNLWNDLKKLLNTVSVDEHSLNLLLTADIDRDLSKLEPVLAELESAINAIRGNDKDEEDLGDMRALNERRATYESVIGQFLRKMKYELEKKFSAVVRELLESSPKPDQKVILNALSHLMAYSSITLFIRDISDQSFYDVVGCWETHVGELYESVLNKVNDVVTEKTKKDHKFSLANATAFNRKTTTHSQKRPSMESKQDRLRERLGLLDSSSRTPEVAEVPMKEPESDIEVFYAAFQTILNHVILQQDFLVKFFHMSSTETDLSRYITRNPLDSRYTLLNSSVSEFEFDRNNAREIASSIGSIFQPALDSLIKSIVQGLRNDQKNTPGVMLWIELFEKQFQSSNQEYLLNAFKRLQDRLSVDWAKFVDMENKIIVKNTLAHRSHKEVSVIVKNFCSLVAEIEKTFVKTLAEYPVQGIVVSNLETSRAVDRGYTELSKSILKGLSEEFEEKTSRFKLHEGGDNHDKRNYLVNLVQNSNWVIDSLTPLKLPSLTNMLADFAKVYNNAKEQYIYLLVEKNFGKVATFVNDVQGLIKETAPKSVDPSRRNAYNKGTLNKLLSNYNSREVNKIVNDMRQEVVEDFNDSEGSELQRQLVEKVWSSLQAEFVTITMGLTEIIDRYYRDVDHRFTKKDIIAAFNASRISH